MQQDDSTITLRNELPAGGILYEDEDRQALLADRSYMFETSAGKTSEPDAFEEAISMPSYDSAESLHLCQLGDTLSRD